MLENELTPWPDELVEHYRRQGYWSAESLDSILLNSAQRFPDRVAVVAGVQRLTYARLNQQVTDFSLGLRRCGLSEGGRVLVQLPNCLEAIQVILSLFRAGAVPILCLPGHRLRELIAFAEKAEAIAYITALDLDGADGRELARGLLRRSAALRKVFVVGDDETLDAEEFGAWKSLAEDPDSHEDSGLDAAKGGGELALLQLSGGSTGESKLIPRTHDDYLYSIRRSTQICEWNEETVYLIALPWGHNFPMSSPGFLGCLLVGGRVVVAPDASPGTCLRLIQDQHVTVSAAVPGVAQAWLEAQRHRQLNISTLTTIQVGGARLFPELAQSLEFQLGVEVQQVFGMAEGLVCYTRPESSSEQRMHTQGYAMSEADEVRVVNELDEGVPVGEVGHLLTRGPYTIRGYYRAGRANGRAFTVDGFYRTGDLVRLRPDGYLVVEGRSKEIINRGGEKVSPAELEELLRKHPELLDAAVLGCPDARLGERIVAFYCPHAGRNPSAGELTQWLRATQVASFKIPDRFVELSMLPRTPVGKIDKPALLAGVQSRIENAIGVEKRHEFLSQLATFLDLSVEELSPETDLLERGLDSLRLVSLVELFRSRGVEISFVDLAEEPTVEAFQRIWESQGRAEFPPT